MKVSRKKRKVTIIFLVLLLLIIVPIIFLRVYSYTLTNFYDISVYTPDGMADEYEGVTVISTNEDHRIWKFDLNKREKEEINSELSNQIWQVLSHDKYNYVNETYFNELKLEFNDADDIYYCLYDCNTECFKLLDNSEGTLLIYQHNVLYVYNKTLGEYYCVVLARR